MKRLLLVPAVCGPVLAVAWVKGLWWPVITTAAAVLGRRTVTDSDEADVFA